MGSDSARHWPVRPFSFLAIEVASVMCITSFALKATSSDSDVAIGCVVSRVGRGLVVRLGVGVTCTWLNTSLSSDSCPLISPSEPSGDHPLRLLALGVVGPIWVGGGRGRGGRRGLKALGGPLLWCAFALAGDLKTCSCVRFPGVGNTGILGGW